MMKLLTEFPDSPEARALLAEKSGKNYVTDASSAQYYLYFGRENVLISADAPEAVLKAPEGALESGTSPALQTGLFNSQGNALAQAAALKKAGFSADVVQRSSSNKESGEYWAVTVRAGVDMHKTVMGLKNAGYEAFPVY
jgi:hypothetical protein